MKTDDELNALFAEHVAGYRECGTYDNPEGSGKVWLAPDGKEAKTTPCLRWATDANAVLPWLEKAASGGAMALFDSGRWAVHINLETGRFSASIPGPTFPRAAVIALLRAKGVEV